MSDDISRLGSPFSTGGGGVHFEERVQAAFTALMLANGYAPCNSLWPITKIKLQGKYDGFDTDDLIVYLTDPATSREKKLLAQMKHSIAFTDSDREFPKVISAAWSDFSNPKIFAKDTDSIALITGPLNKTDMEVRTILEWARSSPDATDFFNKVEKANFSSKVKREKLQVFRNLLKKANGGVALSDHQLWDFLKCYHVLGYDLDIRSGVIHSLLHSVIGQFSTENIESIWASIVYETSNANQNAAIVTIDSMPEELRTYFRRPPASAIPTALSRGPVAIDSTNWNESQYANDLAMALVLGSWTDNSPGDRGGIEQFLVEKYDDWISRLREVIQLPKAPLAFGNGQWRMTRKGEMWSLLGPRIFDEHLDRFQDLAKSVLSDIDRRLQPSAGKTRKSDRDNFVYSRSLRDGLADTLALTATQPKALTHSTEGKTSQIAPSIIRELLTKVNWIRWGSLNDVMARLAESAPSQFIEAIEAALNENPSPIAELFESNEREPIGGSRIGGIVSGLEVLAWDEAFLSRVAVLLGRLNECDAGSARSHRPANSLTTVFLPWFPQTNASFTKQAAAIKALAKEVPSTAWTTLLSLLPNRHGVSFGTRAPKWRHYKPVSTSTVNTKDYWSQVSVYAGMAVEMALKDSMRLLDLVQSLASLPAANIDTLLGHLESTQFTALPSERRAAIWSELAKFARAHRKYPTADWAVDMSMVEKVEKAIAPLAPQDPILKNRMLFGERDRELYEGEGDWQVQRARIEERRNSAVREVYEEGGIELVVRLANAAERPAYVGSGLAVVAGDECDSSVLPVFLEDENKNHLRFASGYVWTRHRAGGFEWVDRIEMSNWSHAQLGVFFTCLPFTNQTWERVTQHLPADDGEYWTRVGVNPYQAEGDFGPAIDKLLQYNRPDAALDCIHRNLDEEQPLDHARAINALRTAAALTETSRSLDVFNAVEIVKALQNDETTNRDDLLKIEWLYVPVLDEFHGASPKFLELRLASDPMYFCELIRMIFRSTKEGADAK